MNSWHVYLLACADGTLYCGVTNDLKKRVMVHNAGTGAKYTRARRPVVLVWSARSSSKSMALKKEYAVKRLPAAEKKRLAAVDGLDDSVR